MSNVVERLKNEPVYLFGVLEAVLGVLIATEVLSPTVGGSVAAVFAVLGGGTVRRAVTPVRKLVDGITGAIGGEPAT